MVESLAERSKRRPREPRIVARQIPPEPLAQVADVARTAGVAAGTVYLYFRSKDDLLISIFEKTMKEVIAEGRETVRASSAPVDRLRAIARLHLGRMGRDRAL